MMNSPLATEQIQSEQLHNDNEQELENSQHIEENLKAGLCLICQYDVIPNMAHIFTDLGYYHEECFVCSECLCELPDLEYVEMDKRVFCKECYFIAYSPICTSCKTPIVDKVKKYQELTWHEKCFMCHKCGCDFKEQDFCITYEKPYCFKCAGHSQKNDFICDECFEPITSDLLSAYEHYYHSWHFKCARCDGDVDEAGSNKGSNIYCGKCYAAYIGFTCNYCKEAILDQSTTIEGRYYHQDHLLCGTCCRGLKDKNRYEYDGYVYCIYDLQRITNKLCHTCGVALVGKGMELFNKLYCPTHIRCFYCGIKIEEGGKISEVDNRPTCNDCWPNFPEKSKKSIKKAQTENMRLQELEEDEKNGMMKIK